MRNRDLRLNEKLNVIINFRNSDGNYFIDKDGKLNKNEDNEPLIFSSEQ